MNSKEIKIRDGIILHCMNTGDRFKTNYISINVVSELSRDTITKNALITLVLRRGCQKLKTMKEISIKLEEMYGAILSAETDKIGDGLVTSFNLNFISDEYTLENEELFKDGAALICDMLLNPVLENGAFKEEYVSQEKDSLKELIESKINNKTSYAMERCVEEMFKNEPFGLYKYGYVEDLDSISAKDLYAQYKKVLKESQIYIYVSGNIDEQSVKSLFEEKFKDVERDYKEEAACKTFEVDKYKEVVDHQNVTQGKIVFGYRVKDYNSAEDFYKMNIYSAILGGTASSKLFCNVREKKSLAYTIRSQYLKYKGAMMVSAGIELENYEIAKECIFKEINDMKIGEITEEEIHDAKVNLITRFKAINDSQTSLVSWALGQKLFGGEEDLNTVIEKINNVSKEDVMEVASRLELAISYYLAS